MLKLEKENYGLCNCFSEKWSSSLTSLENMLNLQLQRFEAGSYRQSVLTINFYKKMN